MIARKPRARPRSKSCAPAAPRRTACAGRADVLVRHRGLGGEHRAGVTEGGPGPQARHPAASPATARVVWQTLPSGKPSRGQARQGPASVCLPTPRRGGKETWRTCCRNDSVGNAAPLQLWPRVPKPVIMPVLESQRKESET